jgi:hypothetical protein
MTKDDRIALIRARFAQKAGSRVWVSEGRKRHIPTPQNPNSGPAMDSRLRAPWTDSTGFAVWIKTADAKAALTVHTEQPGKVESAVTKAARAVFEHNRMKWAPDTNSPKAP